MHPQSTVVFGYNMMKKLYVMFHTIVEHYYNTVIIIASNGYITTPFKLSPSKITYAKRPWLQLL